MDGWMDGWIDGWVSGFLAAAMVLITDGSWRGYEVQVH